MEVQEAREDPRNVGGLSSPGVSFTGAPHVLHMQWLNVDIHGAPTPYTLELNNFAPQSARKRW